MVDSDGKRRQFDIDFIMRCWCRGWQREGEACTTERRRYIPFGGRELLVLLGVSRDIESRCALGGTNQFNPMLRSSSRVQLAIVRYEIHMIG